MLTIEQLQELAADHECPCISLYMSTSVDGSVSAKTLENAIRKLERELQRRDLEAPSVTELLDPLRRLIATHDPVLTRAGGLAILRSADTYGAYRLPEAPEDLCFVGDRFRLTGLLPLLLESGAYYVLALSTKQVRVLRCTREDETPIVVTGMPASLEEALGHELTEPQLQLHSCSGRGGARNDAIFHGHGGGHDDKDHELLRFCQLVGQALNPVLSAQPAPLIVAAVDHMQALYRRANRNGHVLAEGLAGNPDLLSPAELRTRAWPLVGPLLAAPVQQLLARYEREAGSDRASAGIKHTVLAAVDGRVEALLVARNAHIWGTYAPETRRLRSHMERRGGDDDLLDLAVYHALRGGGAVYALAADDMPGQERMVALLRY